MKFSIFQFLVGLFLIAAGEFSTASATNDERNLFEVMGMERLHGRNLEKLIELKIQVQPELKKYEAEIREIFAQELSWKELEPTALASLEKNFTAKEIEEYKKFYATSAGKKSLELMPRMLSDVIEIGRKNTDAAIEKFMAEKSLDKTGDKNPKRKK